MKKRTLLVLLCFLVASPPWSRSWAEAWSVRLIPYAWLSGMEGTVGVGNAPRAKIDKSVSDILDELEAAFFIVGSATQGRLRLAGDFSWVELEDAGTLPNGGAVSVTTESFTGNAIIGYQVDIEAPAHVEPVAGVRWYRQENTLTIPGLAKASDEQLWADPIVGLRIAVSVTDEITFALEGDIGGFGVGSDYTWQVQPVIGWQFAEAWSSYLGYRYLAIDYDDDDFLYDVSIQGLLLGMGYRF